MSLFKFERPELEPIRATEHSAGYDLRTKEIVTCLPGKIKIIRTGVYIDTGSKEWSKVKDGHYFGLHIRSSMANRGLMLANGVGVIDMDYEKEIGVMIYNSTPHPIVIGEDERVAQLVLNKCVMLKSSALKKKRFGGFGSTGA